MLREYKIEVQDMSPKITGLLKMILDYVGKEETGEFCEGAKCHMDIIRQQAHIIAQMQQNNEDLMLQLQGAINNKKGDEKMEIEEESSIEMEYKSGQNENKSKIKSINGSKEFGKHRDKRVTERNMSKKETRLIGIKIRIIS
ncbi:hypothetical protein GJ496_008645 [Pomphorhynchus laevis]|nr:hypothetical protein GJ496_008645 [Pomphorhynchus laevis]